MPDSQDFPAKKYGLSILALVLLFSGGAALYVGSHNFAIRSVGSQRLWQVHTLFAYLASVTDRVHTSHINLFRVSHSPEYNHKSAIPRF